MTSATSITSQLIMRALAVLFISIFIYRIYQFGQYNSLTLNLWLLLIGEIITVFIVIFARFSKDTSFSPIAIVSTMVASFYFLFIQFDDGIRLLPSVVTQSLQLFAILFQIFAKVSLGFSFGLLPANRGIVTRGAYKVVRHPIYLGYFLNHIGFLLSMFTLFNFFLFVALYLFQGVRIWQEEKILKKDPEYQAYMQKTKYRFIPYLF